MLNIPANIVRKAQATVQSTVHTVASVATGGNRRQSQKENSIINMDEDIVQNAKEKYNLPLKSTPNKDAKTMESLAVKSGFLLKRNEQGVWQKRFICTVPHTFLYYYDNDYSESPRGIIDLELFTQIALEGNDYNILKISPPSDSTLRSFYFQDEDQNILSEWITSLHRDRFGVVRDERDAYQQLQDQFTGQMNTATEKMSSSTQDRNRMHSELEDANKRAEESLYIMKKILIRFGVTEDEMAEIDTNARAGDEITRNFDTMQEKFEKNLETINSQHSIEVQSLQARIDKLERQLVNEQTNRRNLELFLAQQKVEFDLHIRESHGEVDKANMNMQVAVSGKTMAESKLVTLTEQKKLLVKEVKQLRGKLEQSGELVKQLQDMNDNLNTAVSILQKQSLQLQSQLLHNETASSTHDETASSDGGSTEGGSSSSKVKASIVSLSFENLSHATALFSSQIHSRTRDRSNSDASSANANAANANACSSDDNHLKTTSITDLGFGIIVDDDDTEAHHHRQHTPAGRSSDSPWELASSVSINLKDLDWLSPHQKQAMESRLNTNIPPSNGHHTHTNIPISSGASDAEGSSSSSSVNNNASSSISSSSPSTNAGGIEASSYFSGLFSATPSISMSMPSMTSISIASTPSSNGSTARRGSSMFSMFQSKSMPLLDDEDLAGSNAATTTEDAACRTVETDIHIEGKDKDESHGDGLGLDVLTDGVASPVDPDRHLSKLTCFRCNGSVEGPKYSTCKCAIPALSQEEVANSPVPNVGIMGYLAGGMFKSTK